MRRLLILAFLAVSLFVKTFKKQRTIDSEPEKYQKTIRRLTHSKIFDGLFAQNELSDPGVPHRNAGKSIENQDSSDFLWSFF